MICILSKYYEIIDNSIEFPSNETISIEINTSAGIDVIKFTFPKE
jgi:hypothetical protein